MAHLDEYYQKTKKVRAEKCLVIGEKTFRTAKPAAKYWANMVAVRKHRRRSNFLGHAAYHDKSWFNSHNVFNCVDIAYRRSLPIFQKYFGR